jgi:hypothetical protein
MQNIEQGISIYEVISLQNLDSIFFIRPARPCLLEINALPIVNNTVIINSHLQQNRALEGGYPLLILPSSLLLNFLPS